MTRSCANKSWAQEAASVGMDKQRTPEGMAKELRAHTARESPAVGKRDAICSALSSSKRARGA
jgi:hypothetical protein